MSNICWSGGADGADVAWGKAASAVGHEVRHVSFKGHKGSKLPEAWVIPPDRLLTADPILKMANSVLKRAFPSHSEFVDNLLRRNYWQVNDSDSIYAIAGIDYEHGSVFGGTAWAIECFKILYPNSDKIFVYDSRLDNWFQWDLESGLYGAWKVIEKPPVPTGKWTGIGSRELDENGYNAINSLFDK